MAVESRFVVIRNGVEVETFMDKKAADEYDKMLDMADSISCLLEQSPLALTEKSVEEISIFFAQSRDDLLIALQAKKAKPVKLEPTVNETKVETKPETKAKPEAKAKSKVKQSKAELNTDAKLKNAS